MKYSTQKNNYSSSNNELFCHMPKALQTMALIEQRAQAIFLEIQASIERGETTLAEVKRKRGIGYNMPPEVKE